MKEFNVTLYEIFGYLLPGAITSLAVGIIFYWIAIPSSQIYIPEMSKTLAVILLGIAYFSGHVAQAIGNLVFSKIHLSEDTVLSSSKTELPLALVTQVKETLAKMHTIDKDNINARLLYQLCDAFVLHNGNVSDRDIFQYREGFYRGLCVACILLSIACCLMIWHDEIHIRWFNYCDIDIHRNLVIFVFSISVIGSALFFRRYKRFCQYRIVQAVTGFLVLNGVNNTTTRH